MTETESPARRNIRLHAAAESGGEAQPPPSPKTTIPIPHTSSTNSDRHTVKKEGQIAKRGFQKRTWQAKWVQVTTTHELRYYNSRGDKTPKATIPLRGSRVEKTDLTAGKFGFVIHVEDTTKSPYYFVCVNAQEQEAWIQCIKDVCASDGDGKSNTSNTNTNHPTPPSTPHERVNGPASLKPSKSGGSLHQAVQAAAPKTDDNVSTKSGVITASTSSPSASFVPSNTSSSATNDNKPNNVVANDNRAHSAAANDKGNNDVNELKEKLEASQKRATGLETRLRELLSVAKVADERARNAEATLKTWQSVHQMDVKESNKIDKLVEMENKLGDKLTETEIKLKEAEKTITELRQREQKLNEREGNINVQQRRLTKQLDKLAVEGQLNAQATAAAAGLNPEENKWALKRGYINNVIGGSGNPANNNNNTGSNENIVREAQQKINLLSTKKNEAESKLQQKEVALEQLEKRFQERESSFIETEKVLRSTIGHLTSKLAELEKGAPTSTNSASSPTTPSAAVATSAPTSPNSTFSGREHSPPKAGSAIYPATGTSAPSTQATSTSAPPSIAPSLATTPTSSPTNTRNKDALGQSTNNTGSPPSKVGKRSDPDANGQPKFATLGHTNTKSMTSKVSHFFGKKKDEKKDGKEKDQPKLNNYYT